MGPDHRHDLRPLKEPLRQLIPKVIGAAPHIVMLDEIVAMPVFVIDGVRPHEVAE